MRDYILQAKQGDAVHLIQRLVKLVRRRALKPLLQRSQNIELGAAFHGIKKGEAKFLAVSGVLLLKALVLLWSEAVQACAGLLIGRGCAYARPGAQIRMGAQQQRLFFVAGALHLAGHGAVQMIETRKWPVL